ncbi:putative RNA-directed DNA polymerase from transposon X-element [Toxocara canis]|uniref:Putative RNA-directed DNA polymerase from transposon X-element n=1 Tax=Toxocara canis TaxID=6265 RepID=A0A0B2W3F6_TOXCA|nr:putative RNA-directed DNA polymerase from transposon X-element [Toxocara canis]
MQTIQRKYACSPEHSGTRGNMPSLDFQYLNPSCISGPKYTGASMLHVNFTLYENLTFAMGRLSHTPTYT